jgi:hypothetical protein
VVEVVWEKAVSERSMWPHLRMDSAVPQVFAVEEELT